MNTFEIALLLTAGGAEALFFAFLGIIKLTRKSKSDKTYASGDKLANSLDKAQIPIILHLLALVSAVLWIVLRVVASFN